jgi:hypothetical protein
MVLEGRERGCKPVSLIPLPQTAMAIAAALGASHHG